MVQRYSIWLAGCKAAPGTQSVARSPYPIEAICPLSRHHVTSRTLESDSFWYHSSTELMWYSRNKANQ